MQSVMIIGDCLDSLGLTPATADGDQIAPDCPVRCLAAVISARVVNLLASSDGIRAEGAALARTPATVADVVRLYQHGLLGQIPGLGARAISEIGAGLAFAGLSLHASGD